MKTGGVKKTNRSRKLLEGLIYHNCSDGKVTKMYICYNYDKRTKKGIASLKCNYC